MAEMDLRKSFSFQNVLSGEVFYQNVPDIS